MAMVTKEQFLAQQAQRQAAAANRTAGGEKKGPFVGYFKIPNDKGEAIVRFDYATPDDLFNDVITTHPGNADTKWKRINCINDPANGVTNCPLCAAGVKLEQRLFIKLIEYVRNEDGSLSAFARVWDRPISYVKVLSDLFATYGSLKDHVFKVTRSGTGLDTTYSILYGLPQVYTPEVYVPDFSAFDGYNMVGGQVLDKSYQELAVMAREMTGFDAATVQATTPLQTSVNTAGVDTTAYSTAGAPGAQRRIDVAY